MRDVTWRPRNRPRRSVARRFRGGGLLALLILNAVVIWYHGDPLERLPSKQNKDKTPATEQPSTEGAAREAAPPAREAAASAREAAPSKSEAQTDTATTAMGSLHPPAAGLASAVFGTGMNGAPALPATDVDAYDPLLGMRHPGPVQEVQSITLGPRQTAAAALRTAGLAAVEIDGALASLTKLVDFRRLRPGHVFKVRKGAQGEMLSMDLMQGRLDRVRASREGDAWHAQRVKVEVETILSEVSGRVDSSLWVALVDEAGESPELVHQVVDVFAWEIDFYTQIFPGDTFRLLVEKSYAEGKLVGYGNILAAEMVTAGDVHRAYLHVAESSGASADQQGGPTYYDATGKSMRKQLLKAPLKYGHVTSGFGSRRHPILGYTRAHNGTDYGVPVGTPVWSVGEGRVVRAGWHGGFGKLVEIRHANGWESQYAHLSRIDVKVGQRVAQKQIVGAVGTTGMSTGPHLHYGLRKNGKYVNALTQRFDPGKALEGAELASFQQHVAAMDTRLSEIRLAMVHSP